jgi:uncharacterized protein (DUF58 family)
MSRAMTSPLFDDGFLRRLEALKLAFRRRAATEPEGAILTPRRGQSLEFQEHRTYVPGDEFRHIDWNLAGRFDTLFVKQFSSEEGRLVCLVVDRSASMGHGDPPKLGTALRAAAALGVLALAGAATVRVFRTGDGTPGSPPFRGEGMLGALLDELSRVAAGGPGSPAAALQAVRRELSGPSTVILLSDLWDDEGLEAAIRDLAGMKCEQAVLRILAPEELAPSLAGKVALLDSETGRRHRLYVGDEERAAYRALLAEDDGRWKRACARHQVPFVSVSSAVPATELVLVMLREAGVVR